MRYLEPKNIVEIGSGYSSALMHDVNERFFVDRGGGVNITHIEPYPDRLKSLLKPQDFSTLNLYEKRLQEVPLDVFDVLGQNDILFVDSSHVSKINSDVNKIVFEILPRLRSGVYVHFHDIGYPFENPIPWLREKRGWNEVYLVRSFLAYNTAFEIVFFNNYLGQLYNEEVAKNLPMAKHYAGISLWIRKV